MALQRDNMPVFNTGWSSAMCEETSIFLMSEPTGEKQTTKQCLPAVEQYLEPCPGHFKLSRGPICGRLENPLDHKKHSMSILTHTGQAASRGVVPLLVVTSGCRGRKW